MAMHSFSAGEGDEAAAEKMADFFGPGQVDQTIRQAIHFCWMALPKNRKSADEVESQVRPIADRALKDFREDSLARHEEIVREIAQQMKVPLVDLHDRSLAVCNALGPGACTALMSQNKPDGGYDGTHLTRAGSLMMVAIVADELKKAVPELAAHIRDIPQASVLPEK